MSMPPDVEVVGDCAYLRPSGPSTNEAAKNIVADVLRYARAAGLRKLLVMASGWSGLSMPPIGQRYFNVREWAEASGGRVALALVLRPENIRHDQFGVTVAANANFLYNVFTTEEEAAAWLRTMS